MNQYPVPTKQIVNYLLLVSPAKMTKITSHNSVFIELQVNSCT